MEKQETIFVHYCDERKIQELVQKLRYKYLSSEKETKNKEKRNKRWR